MKPRPLRRSTLPDVVLWGRSASPGPRASAPSPLLRARFVERDRQRQPDVRPVAGVKSGCGAISIVTIASPRPPCAFLTLAPAGKAHLRADPPAPWEASGRSSCRSPSVIRCGFSATASSNGDLDAGVGHRSAPFLAARAARWRKPPNPPPALGRPTPCAGRSRRTALRTGRRWSAPSAPPKLKLLEALRRPLQDAARPWPRE
jgi:hypothetical protein